MKLAKVPVSVASETIPRLMRMDVVNRKAKISKGDGCRLVPILDGKEDIVRIRSEIGEYTVIEFLIDKNEVRV